MVKTNKQTKTQNKKTQELTHKENSQEILSGLSVEAALFLENGEESATINARMVSETINYTVYFAQLCG